jgi:integrase
MATLIKRPGSPYFIAAFDVPQPDGTVRRLKKSTKKTKRSEAMTEAIRMEELERAAGIATGANASRAYAILSEAATAAAKGELSEARARELLARLCEVSTGETVKFYTVRTWAADWLAVKAAIGKKATMARYKAHIDTFLAWMGDKADGKLEIVTKAQVRAFRDTIRDGWTEERAKDTGKRGKADKRAVNHRTAKTANHYAVDVAGMILVGFYAGARIGDCGSLTWGNLNLARKTLSFMPAKTSRKRKRLEVPLHPRLVSWLNHRTPGTDADPLFPSLVKSPVGGRHGLSSMFIAIMEAAEIDRRNVREGTKGGQRAQHARSFHALQHSLTSTLANADGSEEIRRRIPARSCDAIPGSGCHSAEPWRH